MIIPRYFDTLKPIEADACNDCGHDLLQHLVPPPHPCSIEDCLCPTWKDPEVPPEDSTVIQFPALLHDELGFN